MTDRVPEQNIKQSIEPVYYSRGVDLVELTRQCEINLRRQRVDHTEDRMLTTQGNPPESN